MTAQKIKFKRIDRDSNLSEITQEDFVEIVGISSHNQRRKGIVVAANQDCFDFIFRKGRTIELNAYFKSDVNGKNKSSGEYNFFRNNEDFSLYTDSNGSGHNFDYYYRKLREAGI